LCVRSPGPLGPAMKCLFKKNCLYSHPELHTPGSWKEVSASSTD
jgi:hypothetical protein